MRAYDHTEKAKHEQAKHRQLKAIDIRLERHEKVTRFTLTLILTLAGLLLALLANHLFNHSN